MNCTIKFLFLSGYDRFQALKMYVCDCVNFAHCIWAVPSCLASFIPLTGKDSDPLWKHKGVAVPACHPTTLAAALGTVTDDAFMDTSSLLLGTQQRDKNCRTEAFIGTRKPVSVAYQRRQRNYLTREPHLEVLQSSHGII